MQNFRKRFFVMCCAAVIALLFCSCLSAPVTLPVGQTPTFTFTRADGIHVDENGNYSIYLLDEEASDNLNMLLASETWTDVDVFVKDFASAYMLYDDAGRCVMVDMWDENALVRVRYKGEPDRVDLYYADAAVYDDFAAFMAALTPLPGLVNSEKERFFNLFSADEGFAALLQPLTEDGEPPAGGFSDAQLAAYAIIKMENYNSKDGNTAEEYHAITEKHFDRKILNFDNGMTETIPGTDRIRGTGRGFNSRVFMVQCSEIMFWSMDSITCDFYSYEISESFLADNPQLLTHMKERLLAGDDAQYPAPILVRVEFDTRSETQNNNFYLYLTYKSVTVLP